MLEEYVNQAVEPLEQARKRNMAPKETKLIFLVKKPIAMRIITTAKQAYPIGLM